MIKKLLYILFTVPFLLQAQSIVTGDSLSPGVIYKNIKDSSFATVYPYTIVWADFDLDGDFINDIRFRITENTSPGYMTINKNVYSLNNLDIVTAASSTVNVDTMTIGSLINKSLTWTNASAGLNLYYYSSVGSSVYTGGFFNSTNNYLAFRIKSPSDTIYGWLLMDCPNLGTIKIRSWAYRSMILGVKNMTNISETVSLFPNPVSKELNLNCNGQQVKEIKIFNCVGAEILNQKQEIVSRHLTVDVSQLKNGIYFIQLSSKDSILTKKFIKE